MVLDQEVDYDEKVKELQEWWTSHPRLPKKIGEFNQLRHVRTYITADHLSHRPSRYTVDKEMAFKIKQKCFVLVGDHS